MSAGISLLGLLSSDSPLWVLAGGLVVLGLGLGLLSTPISTTAVGRVPAALAGTAAGVFKMSSMVGGALGVALLTALARAYGTHEALDAAHEAGLSDAQIDQAQRALVNSDSFETAIRTLPAETRSAFTGAAEIAFSGGVADALLTTGLLALAATVVVAFLWPRPGHRRPADTAKGIRTLEPRGGGAR